MTFGLQKALDGNMGRPDYSKRAPLPLRELIITPELMRRFPGSPVKAYSLGECSVIITWEEGRWHLSIAHPRRYPHWDEICEARYRLVPDDVYMAMVLPPLRGYININNNCFQLKEVRDEFLEV
jgi:hypothetical protein